MKTVNMKWLLNIAILLTLTAGAQANSGKKTVRATAVIEVKQINKEAVAVSCNLKAVSSEYYELERSSDNINFKTVGIIFPATENQQMRNGIQLKEKVGERATVYYRLKKINGEEITYTGATAIQLQ